MSCDGHDHDADSALLDMLTGPSMPNLTKIALPRRDAALDPLLLAAAAASGPHVTRNHYHHDFFPGVMDPKAEGAWDWTRWTGDDAATKQERKRLTYVSRQAPRKTKLGINPEESKENDQPHDSPTDPLKSASNIPLSPKRLRVSAAVADPETTYSLTFLSDVRGSLSSQAVEVKCMARTRIPTPHGPAFLHLYHNNRDQKEHLAIVIDSAQFSDTSPSLSSAPPIRSRSLDAVWNDSETEMERITRGAYVGKLTPTTHAASQPSLHVTSVSSDVIPSPLIRIHSECFTGETVGSMRCDCGEQLDEAIRLISQPIAVPPSSTSASSSPTTIPGRGAVIYMRQEGRGIGLLSKIRAYNLQDLGHDTVTANLMLGHKADERGYEIACAILRDLGLGSEQGESVRVLTNNPDKVQALENEGLRVVERVPMIPRSWQKRHQHHLAATELLEGAMKDGGDRVAGATLIGGGAVHGEDLDKYLRTKVLRMGHMLPLWLEDPEQ